MSASWASSTSFGRGGHRQLGAAHREQGSDLAMSRVLWNIRGQRWSSWATGDGAGEDVLRELGDLPGFVRLLQLRGALVVGGRRPAAGGGGNLKTSEQEEWGRRDVYRQIYPGGSGSPAPAVRSSGSPAHAAARGDR
jgi:hypothetical protein